MSRAGTLSKKMPEGVWSLCLIQTFSTLGYSILYSTLVLYMTGKLGMSMNASNSIMGVFIAFNFGLHLLGGYIGGRFLSYRALYCVGMGALVVGSMILALESEYSLYYGLAAFLTGCGLNVTCLYCMLTQRFEADDQRRQTAFLWTYACMNAGFFIGFTASGYFQLLQNYQALFIMGGSGNLISLILCFLCWKKFGDINTPYIKKSSKNQIKGIILGLLMITLIPFFLMVMLRHPDWANQLVLFMAVAMVGLVCVLALYQNTQLARNKLFAFAMLVTISLIFWTLYQLAPMGLMHFIDNNVQRQIGHWIIPPQWFQNINTICIVVGGPLLGIILSRMHASGKKDNTPLKFACALFLIGLAFILLPIGISCANTDGLINPGWIVLTFVLQSIGELLISPIGYAMIGALAPVNLQGILMGIWMLFQGVGATLASYSSNWISADHGIIIPTVTNPDFSQGFLILGLAALAGAVAVYCMVPVLNRWMHQESVEQTTEASGMQEPV